MKTVFSGEYKQRCDTYMGDETEYQIIGCNPLFYFFAQNYCCQIEWNDYETDEKAGPQFQKDKNHHNAECDHRADYRSEE